MQIFLEPTTIDEIKTAIDYKLIDGITLCSNTFMKNKSGLDKAKIEILKIMNGPVSIEAKGTIADEILGEARKTLKNGPNTVLKIKMSLEGLKAAKILSEQDIPVNLVSITSPVQAAMAARSGAEFVTIDLVKVDEKEYDIFELLNDTVQIFRANSFRAKIIISGLTNSRLVTLAIKAGVDIISISYNLLMSLAENTTSTSSVAK